MNFHRTGINNVNSNFDPSPSLIFKTAQKANIEFWFNLFPNGLEMDIRPGLSLRAESEYI